MQSLTIPSETFSRIKNNIETFLIVPEGPRPYEVGTQLVLHPSRIPSDTSHVAPDDLTLNTPVFAEITDISREYPLYQNQYALLFFRVINPILRVNTPAGVLTIDTGDTEYPGIAILLNEQLAAVVEWHPEYQTIVIRSYTEDNDEPHIYHRWDNGQNLPL